MPWAMPGRNDWNALQKEYYNGDEGYRAIWQNLADYYTKGQGNNSGAAANAFARIFGQQKIKYTENALANPTQNMGFDQWLEQNQPGFLAEYNNSSRANRGGQRGFDPRLRSLW